MSAPSPATSAPTGSQDPANDPALARFYEQTPTWTDCRNDFECAKVTVPLDWAAPSGETIELSLLRLKADGKKIGTMLLNPGGPGVSAVEWFRSSPGSLGTPTSTAITLTWDASALGILRCLHWFPP